VKLHELVLVEVDIEVQVDRCGWEILLGKSVRNLVVHDLEHSLAMVSYSAEDFAGKVD